MKRFYKAIIFILIGLLIGIAFTFKTDIFQTGCAQSKQEQKELSSLSTLETQTIKVAQHAGEAVVSISTEVKERVGGRYSFPFNDSQNDEFFRRFFKEFFGSTLPEREFRRMGLGSGVIIDKGGFILTNEHVIAGADKIKVRLSDGREFDAEVKGKDVRSDLAIIKIKANNLPVAELGNSEDLKIGQWVLAIGNPFGFAIEGSQPTVTVGVISALDRDLPALGRRDRSFTGLIQTDAAINPGNSGGPLVNLKGQVIGINVAIITTTGGYQGLGFAIPVNKAKRILKKLIKGEEILYGWLGVNIQDVNEDLKEYFKLKEEKGAIVVKVYDNSPASKAGLKEGDLLLSVDGKDIKSIKELVNIISNEDPGTKVKLNVLRNNRKLSINVILGKRPQDLDKLIEEAQSQAGFRGLEVENITSELKRRYRIVEKEGVIVTYVEPNSPADEAGIIASDIIIGVESKRITNKEEFLQATKGFKGDCLVKTNRGFFVIKEKKSE